MACLAALLSGSEHSGITVAAAIVGSGIGRAISDV
jgi:hypothetical protein